MAAVVSQSPVSIPRDMNVLIAKHPAAWPGSRSWLGEALSLVSWSLTSYRSVGIALNRLTGVCLEDMDLCQATLASHA